MLDADRQRIRRYVVARRDRLILDRLAGESKVQLVPAVSLLQLVRGVRAADQRQYAQPHQSAGHGNYFFSLHFSHTGLANLLN